MTVQDAGEDEILIWDNTKRSGHPARGKRTEVAGVPQNTDQRATHTLLNDSK